MPNTEPAKEQPKKKRRRTVLHRKTIEAKYKCKLPDKKITYGYHTITLYSDDEKKNRIGSGSFYVKTMESCCGGIFVHGFALPVDLDRAEPLIGAMTEYLHNLMNKNHTPIASGTITTAAHYHAHLFKKFGWQIGTGVQSMKHRETNGYSGYVPDIIYPISLLCRKMEREAKVYDPKKKSYSKIVVRDFGDEDDEYYEDEDFDPDFDDR